MKTLLCDRCRVEIVEKPYMLSIQHGEKARTYELCEPCFEVFQKLIDRRLTLFDLKLFKPKRPAGAL
jgi:hypothetical protein